MLRIASHFLIALFANVAVADEPCCIKVVDKDSGWPVPMVQLRTVHGVKFYSDNAGVIAIDQPELMNRETFFHVEADGYEFPKDVFGYAGLRLTPRPGETLKVEVSRKSIAARIGRLTGGGMFAESQKLGRESQWKESGILGCDSVLMTEHNGRRVWLWGDSNLYYSPLGIFNCSAATTGLTDNNWLQPPLRPQFDYFRDPKTKRPRGVVDVPGEGLVWLTGMISLPDKTNKSRLVATYMRVKAPMNVYTYGLCVWNEDTQAFELVKVIWEKSEASPQPPLLPIGHPFIFEEDGKRVLMFGNPFPTLRCPPTFEAWQDQQQWKELKPQESVTTADKPAIPAAGSAAFNKFRNRWITIFTQKYGKPSFLGEVWYAEADAPTGPWGQAIKVLSHRNYSFYNPRIHPEFTKDDPSTIIFEGTYTTQFTAGNPEPTPRYDYNQILYRLDLKSAELKPAKLPAEK